MRARSVGFAAILLPACCLPVISLAQSQTATPKAASPKTKGIEFPDRPGRFALEVSVTGADGTPAGGLSAADFQLEDNGKPSHIFTVSQIAPGGPFQVVLVIDELNPESRHMREAAQAFLRSDSGHLPWPVSVYLLNEWGLSSVAESSRDGYALAERVAHPHAKPIDGLALPMLWGRPSTQDRMIDPLFKEIVSQNALGAVILRLRDEPGRKLVVWMGGGWMPVQTEMEHPLNTITEFSTRMRDARMVLDWVNEEAPPWDKHFPLDEYARPALTDGEATPARQALPVLATQSGGRILFGPNVPDILLGLGQQAAASYTVTFDPADTDRVDDYHALKLTVIKPGFEVRTCAGYYDEPTYFDHPNTDVDHMTVAQLDAFVGNARSRPSSDVLRELARIQLTERLSTQHLLQLLPLLKDDEERQQLTGLADASAFLRLPAAEIPNDPAPSPDEQRVIIQSAFQYLKHAIPRLPDFFAERKTVFYEPRPLKTGAMLWKAFTGDPSVHPAAISTATVLYRNGREVVNDEVNKKKRGYRHQRGLETSGEFGVALSAIFYGAEKDGTVGWDHWERGPEGLEAVFHLQVPVAGSRFMTAYCCTPDSQGKALFERLGAYHGEFAVDPKTGAILRIAVSADFNLEREPDLPLVRSATVIEYAPVKIGSGIYICPVRSIWVTRGRTVAQIGEWGGRVFAYGPFEDMIDDMSFSGYHRFGSESRILTGVDEVPEPQGGPPR